MPRAAIVMNIGGWEMVSFFRREETFCPLPERGKPSRAVLRASR
jgi:hypothetical protein